MNSVFNNEWGSMDKIKTYLILLTGIIICLASNVSAQIVDTDGDGIFDDGNGSGVVGDNPCIGGNSLNCEDNCISSSNPNQSESDGDGIGNACEVNAILGSVEIRGGV